MSTDVPRARRNGDGSIDVWTRGRRVHFAGKGKEPTVTDAEQPPADAGTLPDEVLSEVTQAATVVTYDGWLVRATGDLIQLLPTRARRSPGRVFSHMPGRGGDYRT